MPTVSPAIDAKPDTTHPVEPVKLPEPRAAAPEPKPYDAKTRAEEASAPSAPESNSSYLQVAALPRPDAESMLRTLRDQHFPGIVAASPKPGFYRVLVGPYRQMVQLSDAKSKLKALGFNNAFVQKQ